MEQKLREIQDDFDEKQKKALYTAGAIMIGVMFLVWIFDFETTFSQLQNSSIMMASFFAYLIYNSIAVEKRMEAVERLVLTQEHGRFLEDRITKLENNK